MGTLVSLIFLHNAFSNNHLISYNHAYIHIHTYACTSECIYMYVIYVHTGICGIQRSTIHLQIYIIYFTREMESLYMLHTFTILLMVNGDCLQ